MKGLINKNEAKITGKIVSEPEIFTVVGKIKLLKIFVEVKRKSGEVDILPAVISHKLMTNEICKNAYVYIEGQIRQINKLDNKVDIFLFAKHIEIIEEKDEDINEIILTGFICKKDKSRETRSGRKVSNAILAVNRKYDKTDYMTVIAWGANSIYLANRKIGNQLEVLGRFQSREYTKTKRIEDKKVRIPMTTYEISALEVDMLENNN